jgi:hypothetical protein
MLDARKGQKRGTLYMWAPSVYGDDAADIITHMFRRTDPGEARAAVQFQAKLGSNEARRKRRQVRCSG